MGNHLFSFTKPHNIGLQGLQEADLGPVVSLLAVAIHSLVGGPMEYENFVQTEAGPEDNQPMPPTAHILGHLDVLKTISQGPLPHGPPNSRQVLLQQLGDSSAGQEGSIPPRVTTGPGSSRLPRHISCIPTPKATNILCLVKSQLYCLKLEEGEEAKTDYKDT